MIFATTLFRGSGFDRSRVMTYGPEHVGVLASMLRRHGGHDLVCIHDGQEMPAEVRGIEMPTAVKDLPTYAPKLYLFSQAVGDAIGERYACIDLDVILLGDVSTILPAADFAIWDQARGEPYNSSLMAMEPGARRIVWDNLTPDAWGRARSTTRHRWTGDQTWIAECLGEGEATFSEATGVLQYRPSKHRQAPPDSALALFTCGPYRPDLEAAHSPWIGDAYR